MARKDDDDSNDSYELEYCSSPVLLLLLHETLVYCPPLVVVDILYQLLNERAQLMHMIDHQRTEHQHYGCSLEAIEDKRKGNHTLSTNTRFCLGPDHITDRKGRKPLHIALIYRCEIQVIRRLISGLYTNYCNSDRNNDYLTASEQLALSVDHFGRTALHYAASGMNNVVDNELSPAFTNEEVDSAVAGNQTKSTSTPMKRRWTFSNNTKSGKELIFFSSATSLRCGIQSIRNKEYENQMETVETLIRACPETAYVKDTQGWTPIDLARKRHQMYADDQRILLTILNHASDMVQSRLSSHHNSLILPTLSIFDASEPKQCQQFQNTTTHHQEQTLHQSSTLTEKQSSLYRRVNVVAEQDENSTKITRVAPILPHQGVAEEKVNQVVSKLVLKASKVKKDAVAAQVKLQEPLFATNNFPLLSGGDEVVNEYFVFGYDNDDISSVGSNGVSVYWYVKQSPKLQNESMRSRRFDEYLSFQHELVSI